MQKFKPGDVVKLKSGGPSMTIGGYSAVASGESSTIVMCRWFVRNKAEHGNFDEVMLVLEEDDQKK